MNLLFIMSSAHNMLHQYVHANHTHKRCYTSGAEKHLHNEEYAAEDCTFCLFHHFPKELSEISWFIGLKPMDKDYKRYSDSDLATQHACHQYHLRGPPVNI
jgi:hypothetical protein